MNAIAKLLDKNIRQGKLQCTKCKKLIVIQSNLSLAAFQKEEKQMIFKTDYRLMSVKSIAECSSIL